MRPLNENAAWASRNTCLSYQTRSNFQVEDGLTKRCLSCPVLFQDSENVIQFYRRFQMRKSAFQKVLASPLPDFITIAEPKIKILFWSLACLLLSGIFVTHLPFFYKSKILIFMGICSWKIEVLIFPGQIQQKPGYLLCKASNFAYFGVIGLNFLQTRRFLNSSQFAYFTQNDETWCY